MSSDIKEEDFNLWRHHPVTALVLRYLGDYRQALIVAHVEEWQAGSLNPARDAELRGRVLACGEIAELKLDAIQSFYATEEDDREREADQDREG